MRLVSPELVGRDLPLRTLARAVDAVHRGRGGTVFVSGEAGIGKSRLTQEVERLAAGAELHVLRGRATAGSPVQYRPLSEALFSVLRRAGPPADSALAAYRPALSRLVPEWRLERPPGADDSIVVLAEAVLRLVAHVGRERGCLVVLEDLQDADPDTLAVVEYLADNLDREPVLLVGTLRTESSGALNLVRELAARRATTVLELARLDDEEVCRLAAGCLGIAPATVPAPVLDRLWRHADGVPFFVEELLAGMIGAGALVPDRTGWRLAGPMESPVPVAVVHQAAARAARLGPRGLALLQAAAVVGQRFPAAVVAGVTGLSREELSAHLRAAVSAQLVVAEDEPDTYAFRHELIAEALRAQVLPAERAELSRRAAAAVATVFPGLPDGWCQRAAELRLAAGNPVAAAELFCEAGRRAITQGAVTVAISLLERSLRLVDDGDANRAELSVDITEALLDAYVVAGQIDQAIALGTRLDARAGAARRAAVHLRLARADAEAGRWVDGLREVELVRNLIGPDAPAAATAPLDAVAARLAFGNPTVDRVTTARRLAARALRASMTVPLPAVACEALEILGTCARLRDLATADRLYEHALRIADEHDLTVRQARLQFLLGGHEGGRFATTGRLEQARATALRAGAVVTTVNLDAELAIVRLSRAEYPAAEEAAGRCEELARRLRLEEMRLVGLAVRICVAAHQGRRELVDELHERYRDLDGERIDFTAALYGFGLAICSLLEEDRDRALAELDRSVAEEAARPAHYLSLTRGLQLMLATLSGRAGWSEHDELASSAHAQAAWNHRFVLLSRAVLHGRDGRRAGANQAVEEFLALRAHQPLARHLGLRLVAEAALADGWGDPAPWLRDAETYFHSVEATSVAAACRLLLRRAGARVPQRRQGSAAIPPGLRALGVTVREYEVLKLVAARLGNRAIGQRLFLSPRTVEKHVASLLAKTGQPDRVALAGYAVGALATGLDAEAR